MLPNHFHEYAVEVAIASMEDYLGVGTPLNTKLESLLSQSLSDQCSVRSPTFNWAQAFVSNRIPRARVVSNSRVDSIARYIDAHAFCFANCIFVTTGLLHGPKHPLKRALIHEITHLDNEMGFSTLRCWNKACHSALSVKAVTTFQSEFLELFAQKKVPATFDQFCDRIMRASNRCDYIGRLQIRILPYLLGGWLPYSVLRNVPMVGSSLRAISDGSDWLTTRGIHILPLSKGEGPRHGEGSNYVESDPEKNIQLNLRREELDIQNALRVFHDKSGIPFFHGLTRVLGDLLHATQDRAAHREGRRGYGHYDPRCDRGWSPDDPELHDHPLDREESPFSWWNCNKAAYRRAQNNSCDALQRFLSRSGGEVTSRWLRHSESCSET